MNRSHHHRRKKSSKLPASYEEEKKQVMAEQVKKNLEENNGDGKTEEAMEEEEPEEVVVGPFFTNSEQFSFMTNDAYTKFEECPEEDGGSKAFQFVRPMRGKVGLLENPHGSVRLWQGSTCVIAAVYGPSDVRMSKELPHRAAVDILFRPKVTGTGNMQAMLAAGMMDPVQEERAMEQTIVSILESVIHLEDHVQAGFNVILHEFSNDGCILSTCINAACIALMNAGCSLRSLFAAVTIGVCGDKVVIDPCLSQIEDMKKSDDPHSLLTFVLTNTNNNSKSFSPSILHVSTSGRVSPKALSICYKLLTKNESIISEVFGFFGRLISEDLSKCFRVGFEKGSEDNIKKKDEDDDDVKMITGEESGDDDDYEDVEEIEEEDGEIISDNDDDDE